MSDGKAPENPATLTINWTDYASANLNARIAQLRKIDQPLELDGFVEAVQFLRGVASRASFVLPAFYAHMGSRMPIDRRNFPYWKQVQSASVEYSSLASLSLCCRSIFDDNRRRMTGKRFANMSDATLSSVAEHWAARAKVAVNDAEKAVKLLRNIFRACALAPKTLLNAPSLLARRVGLLKYHADRQAAHISLEPFLFDFHDLVHVVAAITVIGAMIIDFDDPSRGGRYLDSIDEAAWEAGKNTFPALPLHRLFNNFTIHEQARVYWKIEQADGLNMLLNQLPAAIGYWDSEDEVQSE